MEGQNSRLRAAYDGSGRSVAILLSKDWMRDDKGAACSLDRLPMANMLRYNRDNESDRLRVICAEPVNATIIPSPHHRKVRRVYDRRLRRQGHKIEEVFDRIRNLRLIANG